jgi:hypothetical protein
MSLIVTMMTYENKRSQGKVLKYARASIG